MPLIALSGGSFALALPNNVGQPGHAYKTGGGTENTHKLLRYLAFTF